MNATNEMPVGSPARRRPTLEEVLALVRAMPNQEMPDRKTTLRFIDPFEGIVVPEQPFCCPECGCEQYRMVCGIRECSWCHGRGRILGRPMGNS